MKTEEMVNARIHVKKAISKLINWHLVVRDHYINYDFYCYICRMDQVVWYSEEHCALDSGTNSG